MSGVKAPLVSVITVTFNAEKELPRTLESLAMQTSHNFESIIMDGGSRDKTLEVANSFSDRLSMEVISESDDGLYDAMNKGLGLAKGDFVVFMNAGDCFADLNVLKDLESTVGGLGHMPAIIYGQTIINYSNGSTWLRPIRPLEYINHGQPSLHQATVFKRQVHLDYLYDYLAYSVSADYAAMASIHRDHGNEIVCWDRPFAIFYNDPDSASNSRFSRRVTDAWRIQRDILKQPLQRRLFSVVRRALAHVYYNFRPKRKG